MKAYRLTPSAIKLFREGEFHAEALKNVKVSHDSLFQEVPIVVKNSHLVNELLLELSEQVPSDVGSSFLDLGSANVLEEQLKYLMETVDELNQEAIKFNKYQNVALKQCQEKARSVQWKIFGIFIIVNFVVLYLVANCKNYFLPPLMKNGGILFCGI